MQIYYDDYLAHYGVGHLQGGHSGRYPYGSGKYWNPDGTLTEAGKKRYAVGANGTSGGGGGGYVEEEKPELFQLHPDEELEKLISKYNKYDADAEYQNFIHNESVQIEYWLDYLDKLANKADQKDRNKNKKLPNRPVGRKTTISSDPLESVYANTYEEAIQPIYRREKANVNGKVGGKNSINRRMR